jgi:hypothetical protein
MPKPELDAKDALTAFADRVVLDMRKCLRAASTPAERDRIKDIFQMQLS